MKDFNEKTVLVTGAASGIGRATAVLFAREGARLLLADIDADGLEETAREIAAAGGDARCFAADLRDPSEVETLHRLVGKEVGTPDVLVNVAGVALVSTIENTPLEDWEWVLGLNLWGCIHTLHYFLPDMFRKRGGYVVNVASGAGLFAVPYLAVYNTSKHAVVGLTQSLRIEADRYGVGVSVVCPGIIRTPIIHTGKSLGFQDGMRRIADRAAVGPDKMAAAIIRGVRKNRPVIVYPFYIRVLWGIVRFTPRVADLITKANARLFYRMFYSRQKEV